MRLTKPKNPPKTNYLKNDGQLFTKADDKSRENINHSINNKPLGPYTINRGFLYSSARTYHHYYYHHHSDIQFTGSQLLIPAARAIFVVVLYTAPPSIQLLLAKKIETGSTVRI